MTNIREIAKMAGVSVTTVSRVLNNYPYVSEEKRQQVMAVVKKLNYTPNVNAVHLSKGKTNIIAVVLPFVDHPYFSTILKGIAAKALEKHYQFMICQTNYNADEEKQALQLLRTRQVDGIIICSKTSKWEEIEPYTKFGPIVACEDAGQHFVSSVYIDHYEGFLLGMKHLISRGHTSIGYCIARGNSYNSYLRKQAYQDMLMQIGAPLQKEWMFEQCLTIADGARVVKQLMKMKNQPTALLVSSDQVAAGIIAEAKKHDIRVPEDLAVIGFDNHAISQVLDITTIEHPGEKLGEAAFLLTYEHIYSHKYEPKKQQLMFHLIERSTT
ncbi:LacI family DNA-binding transcriptional regulator [Ectobacillus antri]|uniref:LacI family DNA-binding transcriptional regulator n=1 Tax=Ectobacillus antri TaxID=2486280 RepID=A0ABT6H750_9BACI|nr:LacI family DNA-binding transcriptional regulator [Ectobacillus antri]MDG4657417.1 LacI family DNA-binding transcriptional regulator [Ectobacillus antri]MDG5754452.1 LacI family DNA-binding transcriptional regulator [Ectobacillus antri]